MIQFKEQNMKIENINTFRRNQQQDTKAKSIKDELRNNLR
jgi:hypothetical protein